MTGKIKLIVTADDYGIHRKVDDGILKGVVHGAINTVTVLMNFKDSDTELKRLLEVLDDSDNLKDLGIGLHLNITTGKPVLDPKLIPSLVNDKGEFWTFNELKKINLNTLKETEIKNELQAQIELFKEIVEGVNLKSVKRIFLDHFTSQHNILHSVFKFARVIAELSVENKKLGKYRTKPIPSRRPIPILMELKNQEIAKDEIKSISRRTKNYVIWNQKDKVRSFFYKLKRLGKTKLLRVINEIFLGNNVMVPHAMFFSFFGTKLDPTSTVKLAKFKSILPLLYEAACDEGIIIKGDDFFLEVVHHIGDKPYARDIKQVDKISGFDIEYFTEYRKNELQLVLDPYYLTITSKSRNSEIQFANYSDLNKATT